MQYLLLGVFSPKDFALVDHFVSETFSNLVITPTKRQPAQALPVYELKITLRGSNPAIWRQEQLDAVRGAASVVDLFLPHYSTLAAATICERGV